MRHPRRLLYLLVLLALWAVTGALPGRAQEGGSARYAFADTTLLRDTLGLTFTRLFPLADSLGVTPDTLRALSIRYRFPLVRVVHLADSLRVPIDSLGGALERERFNPLAASVRRQNTLHYTSGYDIQQTSTTWTNTSDYSFVQGPFFIRNSASTSAYRAVDASVRNDTRTSTTEVGWKRSQNLSIGARANIDRNDVFQSHHATNGAQMSFRTRQQPRPGITSEFNLFTGVLDESNTGQATLLGGAQQLKQGLSNDLSGRIRYDGRWLTHELNGQLTANLTRLGLPGTTDRVNTHDLANSLRGTLGLFTQAPVSMNVNYQLGGTTIRQPVAVAETTWTIRTHTGLQDVRTVNNGADATMRLRQSSDRYLNLNGHLSSQEYASPAIPASQRRGHDLGMQMDGRYLWRGWNLEGRFTNGAGSTRYPTKVGNSGFVDSVRAATIDGTLSRNFGEKIVARATGRVSINRHRYTAINGYAVQPNNDQYAQNYRLEGAYTSSDRFNTRTALDVTRALSVNLLAARASSNNESDTYRAEWQWTYRLLPGLTATQRNALTAAYTFWTYVPTNNKLSMDYNTITTLNAVLSPRITIDVTHNIDFTPNGNYGLQPDGLVYLSTSGESQSYDLLAHISYTPAPGFSFLLDPEYRASRQLTAQDARLVPQSGSRALNFSGGASVNLPIGRRGRLTGQLARTFSDNRSSTFNQGLELVTPRQPRDFWNGTLNLSWDLQ